MDNDKILILANDKKKRRINYTKESTNHPAKMNIELCRWIIKNFTTKKDVILDPMSGIFTTGVEGFILDRIVFGVEFEKHYVKYGNNSLKFKSRLSEGKASLIQGDSRNLTKIFPDKKFDKIIFSPPFINTTTGFNIKNMKKWMKYRMEKEYKNKLSEDALEKQTKAWMDKTYENPDNISNLSVSKYYSNMTKIYDECFKVLKKSGMMILVTKNPVKEGKQIRLDEETIKMCEDVGFKLADRYYRKILNKGIWQRSYEKKWKEKHPDKECPIANYEDVLVFKKS